MALAFALVMLAAGLRVWPTLYSLLFPPTPPLPELVTPLANTPATPQPGLGQQVWRYEAAHPACDVTTFYMAQGAACDFSFDCDGTAAPGPLSRVAICQQSVSTPGYEIGWRIRISAAEDATSRLHIEQTVNWLTD